MSSPRARRSQSAPFATTPGLMLAAGLGALAMLSTAAYAAPSADGAGHVYELRTYHVLPGRMQALEDRFRNVTTKLLERHDL